MGFRFRRSLKLFPGVRVNLSKSGTSLSLGGKGLSYNIGAKGTKTTAGIPGSGLSYSTYSPYEKKEGGAGTPSSGGNAAGGIIWIIVIALAGFLLKTLS